MSPRRTVQSAKAKSSKGLARGAWIVEGAPQGAPMAVASRVSKRGNPFHSKKKTARSRGKP